MAFSSIWSGDYDGMILNAQVEDYDRIAELHARAFARGWTAQEIANLHDDPSVSILVARRIGRKPGQLDGFNIVRQAADEGEILSVVVDAGLRGSGLGGRLMREAITRFQTDRLASVFLEVAKDNAAAVSLYRRLGFEVVGERKSYYAPTISPTAQEAGNRNARTDTPLPSSESGVQNGTTGGKERGTALVMRLGLV